MFSKSKEPEAAVPPPPVAAPAKRTSRNGGVPSIISAELTVRGTLGIFLEAKSRGLTERVEPWINKLEDAGMWISPEVRHRILSIASEGKAPAAPK